ncbi:MAG: hypothetical protein ACRC33_15105, partial [Gemmataceae bacterium]
WASDARATMTVSAPFWFKQRQCKAEPAGEDALKVSGPNLAEAYLRVAKGDAGRYLAALRLTADGQDVAVTGPEFDTPRQAWDVAFELYRTHVIV